MRRKASILAAVALLATGCEYLFFSPAFMPITDETVIRVDRGAQFIEEYYDDELTSSWTVNPGLPLTIDNGSTTGVSIPAMELLWEGHNIDPWYGATEFLGLFFNSGGGGIDISVPTGWTAASGASINHFGQSFDFEYRVELVSSYDLPYHAVEGFDGGNGVDSFDFPVSVVDMHITTNTADPLETGAKFIFSDEPGHEGLLYIVHYHENLGLTTVCYRTDNMPSSVDPFFPSGTFTYVINVFED